MDAINILKLSPKEFEDIKWSRPENARQASKIIILGGSKDHFAETSNIYQELSKIKGLKIALLLPEYLKKIVGNNDANIVYASSDPQLGYFNKEALPLVKSLCAQSDLLILSGEVGRSSETQQFLESLIDATDIPVSIGSNALQSFADNYLGTLATKPNIHLFIDAYTTQRLFKSLSHHQAFTSTLTFQQKIDVLNNFTQKHELTLCVSDEDVIWCAKKGQIYYSRSRISAHEIMVKSAPWLSWNSKEPLRTITSIFL